MRRVTLKGLLFRRTRAVLTALAVVLGVAMVSGTYVLTDTISSAFNSIFNASYAHTSAVVSGRQIVKNSASGSATIPESLLARVRAVPGVGSAAGALADTGTNSDSVKLLNKQGKVITANAPTFGFGIDTSQPRFNPLHLTQGAWAATPREVVIDKSTADKHHFAVGDRVAMSARGPIIHFRVTGIAKYGTVSSLGGATIAVFTIPTAQRLLGKEGRLDSISIAAAPGVPPSRLVREIRPLLPATAQVRTAAEEASANAKDTKSFVNIIQIFLLAFAGIALFVGAFVIFNTLSITIAQRTREFATLRTLGASRKQVLRSVLLEGAVIGVLASALGLAFGILLAKGLTAVLQALSLDLPRAGTVLKSRTVIVSLVVGITVTVVASVLPALRATRIPPIAAVREGAVVAPSRLARHGPALAIGVVLAGIAAIVAGLFAHPGTGATLLLLGAGCVALFLGVALVAPQLVRPLAQLLGAPARRFGGTPGRLAGENATRNPARTAATAAALMIGLALVTVVATLGSGLRASERQTLARQVTADYVVTSQNGFDAFSSAAGRALPAVPGVGVAATVYNDSAKMGRTTVGVNGVDPATFGRTYRFTWKSGSATSLATIGPRGAIVKKSFATTHHLRVGSPFVLTTPSGQRLHLTVRGISDPPAFDKIDPVLGPVVIPQRTFVASFPRPKILYGFIRLDTGVSPAVTAHLKQALQAFPDAKVQTTGAWITERTNGINKLLNLLYVLLALSVVVSLFGMVNTLVLAVFERTRELGMLRAVGMTRRQVRRMIRQESVITALIGAGLGLPLGLFLAALFTQALSGQGVVYSVPVTSLVIFVVVAVLAGLAAALLPARRAARLDVLQALQYE
jgi:putative ABC transport system permease protein